MDTLTEDEIGLWKIPNDIETAIWFKILVIESMEIDCNKRIVTWSSTCLGDEHKHQQEQQLRSGLLRRKKSIKKISESNALTSAEDMSQITLELDEIFLETQKAIDQFNSPPKLTSKAERDILFAMNLFKVLHRTVLPVLTLNKEDITALEAAKDFQMELIRRQDAEICSNSDNLLLIRQQQFSLREQIYAEVSKKQDGFDVTLHSELALLVYNHIQEDLSHYSQQLTDIQTDVNMLKAQLKQLSPSSQTHEGLTSPSITKTKNSRASVMINSPDTQYSFHDGRLLVARLEPEMKTLAASSSEDVASLQLQLTQCRKVRDRIFERYRALLQVRELLGEHVCDRVIVQKDVKKKITKRQIIRSKIKKVATKSAKKKKSSKRKRKSTLMPS